MKQACRDEEARKPAHCLHTQAFPTSPLVQFPEQPPGEGRDERVTSFAGISVLVSEPCEAPLFSLLLETMKLPIHLFPSFLKLVLVDFIF